MVVLQQIDARGRVAAPRQLEADFRGEQHEGVAAVIRADLRGGVDRKHLAIRIQRPVHLRIVLVDRPLDELRQRVRLFFLVRAELQVLRGGRRRLLRRRGGGRGAGAALCVAGA